MKYVTIIIPMYNSEKYILNCLNTVINQSYKNIKVLLVDDGSTDNTINVCQHFLKKNKIKNMEILSKKNGGPSSARNYGLEHAKTDYICFVDSDDEIKSDYVEKMIKEKNDLVIAGYIEKYYNKEIINNIVNKKKILNDLEFDKMLLNVPLTSYFNSPCCKLYKTSIIKNNKLKFDENINIGEDLKFNLLYFEKCKSITLIPDNLYYYNHININSLTSKFNENRWDIELDLFKVYMNYFKKKNNYKTFEEEINEFLLSSLTKTCYTLIKSNKENKFKINYIKKMINDKVFKNKIFSRNKISNKIAFLSIKIKSYIPIYLFYRIRFLSLYIKKNNSNISIYIL